MRKILVISVASLSLLGLAGCSSSDVTKVVTENAKEQVDAVKLADTTEVQAVVRNTNVAIQTWLVSNSNAKDLSGFVPQESYNGINLSISGTPTAYVITASNADGYTYSFDSTTGQYK